MGNYLRKIKFTAIALLATTTQAADAFHCGNWTVETFTDKTCTTNDTNSTHTSAGTTWAATMTTGATAWANCTQVVGASPARYHVGTCNVQGVGATQWGVKASWKSAKTLMAGSAAAL